VDISRISDESKKRLKKMILTIIALFLIFGMGLMFLLGGSFQL
jgi:hypothetical protein